MKTYTIINPSDNVLVVLKDYKKGEVIEGITLLSDVPQAHKVALKDISKGCDILKYGSAIGHAIEDIKAGEHIHTHNTKTNLNDVFDYQYTPLFEKFSTFDFKKTVDVYERKNNLFGVRNELWIIQTVGCVSGQAKMIINKFKEKHPLKDIDGVFTFDHTFGCSQMGDDHEMTKTFLQGMAKHPNAGGVLVLGLGCENNQIPAFKETLGNYDEQRVKFLNIQDVGDEIAEGVKILEGLYETMRNDKRTTHPLSVLNIGLECGGSDGLSGITANPLLGHFSDYLIAQGGISVLCEVPEMFGAEHILMQRSENKEVFNKVVGMVNDFKLYFKNHDQVIYENPSPGNKAGGITTLEDKSLGCTQKAGYSNVKDVLNMGEMLKTKGLNLLSTPGNDLVATTALGISGCQIVLFTTGRGTPFGGFMPTVKIATNNYLATKKPNWIDFNAGQLVDKKSMNDLAIEFIDYVCDVASGKIKTRNEDNDFRQIAIFKSGVTL